MLLLLATPAVTWAAGLDWYVKRDTWQDTLQASLAARRSGGAARDLKLSDWSWVGPFAIPDNRDLGKVCGRWQYTIAGAPGGVARRSDQAGDEASVDFVGDSIALLHKEGRLERTLRRCQSCHGPIPLGQGQSDPYDFGGK